MQPLGDLPQQCQAGFGDANFHHAAVLDMSQSFDPPVLDEFVDHPRDVRCARHQLCGQLQCVVTVGMLRL